MQYLTVTAVRIPSTRGIRYQTEAMGDTSPYAMEMMADQIRRMAGTYQPLPLEDFLDQHEELELIITPGPDHSFQAAIGTDVSIRETNWGLSSASAHGNNADQARRNLQQKVSGRTIVQCPILPNRREYQAPDLYAVGEDTPDFNAEKTAERQGYGG